MKTSDLDLTTVYAVKSGGMHYRAVALFPRRWRAIKSYAGGRPEIVGFTIDTAGSVRDINAYRGVPVLSGGDDPAALLAAAPAVRQALLDGGVPDTGKLLLQLVTPGAIVSTWADYEIERDRQREAAQRLRAGRQAEAQAQDDARARVLGIAGPDAWGSMIPPARWTEFEALATLYAERIGMATLAALETMGPGDDPEVLAREVVESIHADNARRAGS